MESSSFRRLIIEIAGVGNNSTMVFETSHAASNAAMTIVPIVRYGPPERFGLAWEWFRADDDCAL